MLLIIWPKTVTSLKKHQEVRDEDAPLSLEEMSKT